MGSVPSSSANNCESTTSVVVNSGTQNFSTQSSEEMAPKSETSNKWNDISPMEEIQQTEDSSDSTSASDEENDLNVEVMKNWETLTKNILFQTFFSSEDQNKVDILSFIHHKVLFEKKAPLKDFVSVSVESGLVDVCGRLLKLPIKELLKSNKFYTLSNFLIIIWNCCDSTAEMGDAVINKNLHKSIIASMKEPFLVNQIFDTNSGNSEIIQLCRTMLSVLYNSLRHNPDRKQQLRDDGVIEVTQKFLHCNIPIIKTLALFVLTFAADISSNKNLIEDTSSSIKFIFESLLNPALQSEKHMSGSNDGFSVQEILEALSLLAENPQNATKMADQGVLDAITDLLSGKAFDSEIEPCLNTLFALTFQPHIINRIKSNSNLVSQIQSVKLGDASKDENLKLCATQILWKLNQSEELVAREQINRTTKQHIMISYCHEQKLMAWKIKEKLEQSGKRVWIDNEGMHLQGDILDAMALAVRNASHVICCISFDYFMSKFCRLEAYAAFNKSKNMIFIKVQEEYKAEGWLELIMGGAFYHEFFSDETIENGFWKILGYLDGHVLEENIKHEQQTHLDVADGSNTFRSVEQQPNKAIETWSTEQVNEWYKNTKCTSTEKTKKFLDELDGKLLHELCCWQKRTPEFFLRFVSDHLDLTSVNLIKFSRAIADLSKI